MQRYRHRVDRVMAEQYAGLIECECEDERWREGMWAADSEWCSVKRVGVGFEVRDCTIVYERRLHATQPTQEMQPLRPACCKPT